MEKNPYTSIVLSKIPRLLSQLNRNENSSTYGCFDRNYWQYRIRDFPSMILQQGSLILALLYLNNLKGNIFYGKKKIKEWALASLRFWANNQLKDGSFNEYYPNEHGYPPTVFSLYTTSETYKLLDLKDEKILNAMIKASRFISKRIESGAVNQEIAAITALYNVYLITKKRWILEIVNKKLKNILKKQNREGWFPEYGGVDIGYLSVSLNYLAEYYRLSNNEEVLPVLKRILEFIQYFIHPNGTSGGDYGSRDTEYFLPGGLELLSKRFPLAGKIADKLLENKFSIESIDDRYLCHYILPSFTIALLNYKSRVSKSVLPCEMRCEKYFENAGLYIYNDKYYLVLNLSKGGVIKVIKGKKEILNDCGYVVNSDNYHGTTNWVNPAYKKIKAGDTFIVEGEFSKVRDIKGSPFGHMLLRMGSGLFGPGLIPILKKKMITRSEKLPINFKRRIEVKRNEVIVEDTVFSKNKIKELKACDRFSFRYVPSSKYFQSSDLEKNDWKKNYIDIKKVIIKKRLNIMKESIEYL